MNSPRFELFLTPVEDVQVPRLLSTRSNVFVLNSVKMSGLVYRPLWSLLHSFGVHLNPFYVGIIYAKVIPRPIPYLSLFQFRMET